MKYEIGFIGCGNMGGALARAVAKNVPGERIALCDLCTEKVNALAAELGAKATDLQTLAKECRFVVLGVKPQMLGDTVKVISPLLHEGQVVVCMAAGVSIDTLQLYLGKAMPIIRIMPNTPASLGEGVILYVPCGTAAEEDAAFLSHFAAAGVIDKIEESRIDAASALSGCGPAFVYMFAEAMADGAVECGIPRDKAIAYAARTLCGAARMIEEFGSPASLKDAVCSAGGSTIAGVHALEKGGMRGAVMDAVNAAYHRTVELGKK